MTNKAQRSLGNTLIVVGCLWFLFWLIQIPPLFFLLFDPLSWLTPRGAIDQVLTIVFRGECVMAMAIVAMGVMVRWRATRGLRFEDYIIVLASASLPVLAVFGGYGWMKGSKVAAIAVCALGIWAIWQKMREGRRTRDTA